MRSGSFLAFGPGVLRTLREDRAVEVNAYCKLLCRRRRFKVCYRARRRAPRINRSCFIQSIPEEGNNDQLMYG